MNFLFMHPVLALVLVAAVPALADERAVSEAAPAFDWDLYHDRQDACRELSEAQRACAAYGLAACDQAALDRLQRQCSAFGPLGQRKVGSDHTR
jgi:hypothetical protein